MFIFFLIPVFILNLEHISRWANYAFQICTHIYLGSLGLEESRQLRSRGMLTILSLSGLLWKPDIIDLRWCQSFDMLNIVEFLHYHAQLTCCSSYLLLTNYWIKHSTNSGILCLLFWLDSYLYWPKHTDILWKYHSRKSLEQWFT